MSKKENSNSFSVGDVFTKFDLSSKPTINMRLIDAVVTFDDLSDANIYHVNVMHDNGFSDDAVKCFSKSVKFLCDVWTICRVADTVTRFLVVSHITPLDFQIALFRLINNHKSEHIISIEF